MVRLLLLDPLRKLGGVVAHRFFKRNFEFERNLHTLFGFLVTADHESGIEACKERPLGINTASNMQQHVWSRVSSENNAALELILEANRLMQLQMLTTSIVLSH